MSENNPNNPNGNPPGKPYSREEFGKLNNLLDQMENMIRKPISGSLSGVYNDIYHRPVPPKGSDGYRTFDAPPTSFGSPDVPGGEATQFSTGMEPPATDEVEEAPRKSLEELMAELNALVGLEKVKEDVKSLTNMVKVMKLRKERGMKEVDMTLHLVFTGNPGTGKTTVARLLAGIYREIGVLKKGHLVEVDRSQLVAKYVGQTAPLVMDVVKRSIEGVLFIDEAYSLVSRRGENDFGFEAVDTLLKAMEDHRDELIVIVAGYPDKMDEFLESNPGLMSRFNKFIHFDDYSPENLVAILDRMCEKNGYKMDEAATEKAKKMIETIHAAKTLNFANARTVRNLFEKLLTVHADRLAVKEGDVTDDELCTLIELDMDAVKLSELTR